MRGLITNEIVSNHRISSFQSPYFWPSQNWEPDNVDYGK